VSTVLSNSYYETSGAHRTQIPQGTVQENRLYVLAVTTALQFVALHVGGRGADWGSSSSLLQV